MTRTVTRLSISIPLDCLWRIKEIGIRHNNKNVSAEIRAALKAYITGAADAHVTALESEIELLKSRINDKDEIIRLLKKGV